MKSIVEKFRQTGSISDANRTGRPKTGRSNVNNEALDENVVENPGNQLGVVAQWCKNSKIWKMLPLTNAS